jgi:hypothetical protein
MLPPKFSTPSAYCLSNKLENKKVKRARNHKANESEMTENIGEGDEEVEMAQ